MLANAPGGIDGQVSKAWKQATDPAVSGPSNSPTRLTATSSGRARYWREAMKVHAAAPWLGTGAGSYGTLRLRYRVDARDRPPRARLRGPDARRPRLGRARPVAAGADRLARRRRSACSGCDRATAAAVGRRAGRRWRRWRPSPSSSACTRRSTGRGSSRATRCRRCCAPAGSPRARRCASGCAARAAGRDRRRAPPCRACVGAARSCSPSPRRGLGRAAARALGHTPRTPRSSGSTSERSPQAASIAADRPRTQPARGRAAVRSRGDRAGARPDGRGAPRARAGVDLEPANPETWRRLGDFRLTRLQRPAGRPARLPGGATTSTRSPPRSVLGRRRDVARGRRAA